MLDAHEVEDLAPLSGIARVVQLRGYRPQIAPISPQQRRQLRSLLILTFVCALA
jgi:hypothetical protein